MQLSPKHVTSCWIANAPLIKNIWTSSREIRKYPEGFIGELEQWLLWPVNKKKQLRAILSSSLYFPPVDCPSGTYDCEMRKKKFTWNKIRNNSDPGINEKFTSTRKHELIGHVTVYCPGLLYLDAAGQMYIGPGIEGQVGLGDELPTVSQNGPDICRVRTLLDYIDWRIIWGSRVWNLKTHPWISL